MPANSGRKIDDTSFDQRLRLSDKTVSVGTDLVNNIYKAQNLTSNTEPASNASKIWNPGYSFTIKTPRGRLLRGTLLNDNDIGERLEFVDVKLGGDPITISTRMLPENLNLNSKILRNKMNAEILAKQYSSGKNKNNINLWIDEDKTIDDELDERYNTLKKSYLEMFKKYRSSRPDQQWEMVPEVAEAIIKYNLIK